MIDDFEYFNIEQKDDNSIIFTPKNIIIDIIFEFSNRIIPFSNGERYYVYQDVVFFMIDFYEKDYPYISISISVIDNVPNIIINNIKPLDYKYILQVSSRFLTKYINKKFSLWM